MLCFRLTILIILFHSYLSTKDFEVKIIAKVNNEIITNIDLENRLKMAMYASNLPNDQEIEERLRPRVLDSLIDESLKIQEANRLGIFVTNEEVIEQLNRLEKRLNMEMNSLLDIYKKEEIPEITILNQVRSQLLWEKILYGIVIKNITVSEKDIIDTYNMLLQKSGEVEYNLSEIFISINNLEAEQRINSIYSRINTQNFLPLAEQFSDGVVSSGNFENNWVRESLLEDGIKDGVSKLNVGQISLPIKTSAGYHLVLLNDKRQTKKIKENQTIYDLSQILFKINAKKNKDSEEYYKRFLSSLRDIVVGCNDLKKLIDEIPEGYGGKLGKIDSKSIEKSFLKVLENLPVGILSDAVITNDGVHGLMLCSPIVNNTYEEFKNSIEGRLRNKKIDSAAQSLLNRIKRKALIELYLL